RSQVHHQADDAEADDDRHAPETSGDARLDRVRAGPRGTRQGTDDEERPAREDTPAEDTQENAHDAPSRSRASHTRERTSSVWILRGASSVISARDSRSAWKSSRSAVVRSITGTLCAVGCRSPE